MPFVLAFLISILFGASPGQEEPMSYTQDLPDEFFASVRSIADRLDPTNPYLADWMLTMMQSESGIDPSVGNKAGAQFFGLIQLGKSGFAPLTPQEFTAMSAVDQLGYVERFWKGAPVKSMRSAGNLYQYNFLPSSLSRGIGPDTVLAAKDGTGYGGNEAAFYTQNSALDKDKSGAITVSDLDARLAEVAKSPRLREAVNRLPPPVGGYPKARVAGKAPADSPDAPIGAIEPASGTTKKYIGAGLFGLASLWIAREKGWL